MQSEHSNPSSSVLLGVWRNESSNFALAYTIRLTKCISQEVFYKINNNYIKNSAKRTLEPRIVGASGSLMREHLLCTCLYYLFDKMH
jgi:hypothetical protein